MQVIINLSNLYVATLDNKTNFTVNILTVIGKITVELFVYALVILKFSLLQWLSVKSHVMLKKT